MLLSYGYLTHDFGPILSWLPHLSNPMPSPVGKLNNANGLPLLIFLVVYLVLFFAGHRIQTALNLPGWRQGIATGITGASHNFIFLDRACICQTDAEKKRSGIAALGTIVAKSDILLSCQSRDYFDRLWCCYEIAIFLKLRGAAKINCVPLALPPLIIVAIILTPMTFYSTCVNFAQDTSGNALIENMLLQTLAFAQVLFFGCAVAYLHIESDTVLQLVKKFQLDAAHCFCCDNNHKLPDGTEIACDRDYVEDHVEQLYGSVEAFDISVQTEVFPALRDQLGGVLGLPVDVVLAVQYVSMIGYTEYLFFAPTLVHPQYKLFALERMFIGVCSMAVSGLMMPMAVATCLCEILQVCLPSAVWSYSVVRNSLILLIGLCASIITIANIAYVNTVVLDPQVKKLNYLNFKIQFKNVERMRYNAFN